MQQGHIFLGKRKIKLNIKKKKKQIQRSGDIRPDPGKTQKGMHR